MPDLDIYIYEIKNEEINNKDLQSDKYITDSNNINEEDNLMYDKESYQDNDGDTEIMTRIIEKSVD